MKSFLRLRVYELRFQGGNSYFSIHFVSHFHSLFHLLSLSTSPLYFSLSFLCLLLLYFLTTLFIFILHATSNLYALCLLQIFLLLSLSTFSLFAHNSFFFLFTFYCTFSLYFLSPLSCSICLTNSTHYFLDLRFLSLCSSQSTFYPQLLSLFSTSTYFFYYVLYLFSLLHFITLRSSIFQFNFLILVLSFF